MCASSHGRVPVVVPQPFSPEATPCSTYVSLVCHRTPAIRIYADRIPVLAATCVGETIMHNKKVFAVSFIGFSERERRILRSVAAMSTTRPRSDSFSECNAAAPELYLIDGDDPAAIANWKALAASRSVPAAYVVDRNRSDLGRWCLHRPIVPSRLFAMLDQMTVQELHFLPELHIGQDATGVSAPLMRLMFSHALAAGRSAAICAQEQLAESSC